MSRQFTSLLCVLLCLVWLLPPAAVAQQAAKPAAQSGKAPMMVIKVATEIVLVNMSVKDSKGNFVRGLKPEDVTILEDGKPQHIQSFDFEDVDAGQPATATADAAAPAVTALAAAKVAPKPETPAAAAPAAADKFRDRRLMVMYFDLTTMQPEDVANVIQQAETFVQKKMQPADLVAIASLGNTMQINQDFTADKDLLMTTLKGLDPTTSAGFGAGDDGTTDTGNSFVADSSEFNVADADRSLEALQSLGDMLGQIQQKKSLLYYSSGIQRSGVDNEITLRSAVNALNKANVSVYGMDARGLQAVPPGGNATAASSKGGAFNGGSQMTQLNNNFAQQETISTLSTETGGKSFLEANDFGVVYTQVQKDTQSYYLIGYSSSNKLKDGKYRKIQVKVNRPDVTVSAKPGYYAGRDINHQNTADRQAQLQDELEANVSDNSLNLYIADGFLRLDAQRYYVPVAVTIPGNEIPLHGTNPKATPEVDIAGEVIDQTGRKLDHVGQTIQLTPSVAGGATQDISNKNLQFNTGFILAPGQKYQVRFAARENQTGQMGAFETVLQIPDMAAQEAKEPNLLPISSVLIGSQLDAVRPDANDPLTDSGNALVLNVNHVFATNQNLYIYYEVYDPKITGTDAVKLLTNVAFYTRNRVKAFETPIVTTEQLTDPKRKVAVIQLAIPLSGLKPGSYTCQVNAIDDAAGKFAFPRIPIVVRPAAGGAVAAGK